MDITTTSSELFKTASRFVDGYNQWDIEAILAPRATSCKQRVYPDRLGRPYLNNSEYREYFSKTIMPSFKRFHVEVLEVVEDLNRHKVSLHAKSTGETVIGDYGNEYMILLEMTEDDQRVIYIKEFVDSGYSQEYFTRLKQYQDTQS